MEQEAYQSFNAITRGSRDLLVGCLADGCLLCLRPSGLEQT